MIRAHRIRLDPNNKQATYFRRACGTARWTYNWALAEWEHAYQSGEKPSGRALRRHFNSIRREHYPWTYTLHKDCTSRPFDELQAAFNHFFRRVRLGEMPGHPVFKKKGKAKDSFYVGNTRMRIDGCRVRLPKIGWIKTREALRFDGKVLGAVVSRVADQWHIAIQVDIGAVKQVRTGNGSVGLDLGIKASATFSTGEVVDGPKALAKHLKRLRRLSRRHSRKSRGSNGLRKSAMGLARLHNHIANLRNDWTHKLSTRLVRENQAVGIEDLLVRGMVRNRRLARSILDEGWGNLRKQLEYKALAYGTKIVVFDRWLPSSKMCSRCGVVKKHLSLSQRVFTCDSCGLVLDRDFNAARNLVPQGMGELTPVEIVALAEASALVKLRSLNPESSSYQARSGGSLSLEYQS